MARIADTNIDAIFTTAQEWGTKCLIEGKSLLWPARDIWSKTNLGRFKTCYIDRPDTSKDKNFEKKLQEQLANADDDVTRLACELLLIYFQFPSEDSVSAARKAQLILQVAKWKNLPIDDDSHLGRFGAGVGNPGLVYNTGRPNELTYLARFALALTEMEPAARAALLTDHRQTRALLDTLAETHRNEFGRPPQIRHVLLYLLYPDEYERIASEGHKDRISEAFGEIIEGLESTDIDDRLKAIRTELEKLIAGTPLDFYWDPLRPCWYSPGGSETISPLQALQIKKQIVLYGPPGTGKTYQARAVAHTLVQQALLKTWGPKRYFTDLIKVKEISSNRVQRTQFHPGYGYEDFIRGLQLGENGKTEYRDGVLLRLVTDLNAEPEDLRNIPFVLILDEMNRADLSRVLGECFSLMEDRDTKVQLAGHDAIPRLVQLPDNLYIIGTMNLIDQSLEHVDFALRRRFFWVFRGFTVEDFLEVSKARWEGLRTAKKVKLTWERVAPEFTTLAERARRLNEEIDANSYLGQQYQIGHTYFCDVVGFVLLYLAAFDIKRQRVLFNAKGGALDPVLTLWQYAIEPLLGQYLSGIDAAERIRILSQFQQVLTAPP